MTAIKWQDITSNDTLATALARTLGKEIRHMQNLRQAFMNEHCLNGTPNDDCGACEFARSARNKEDILKKQQELQAEINLIRTDHLMGEDPGITCSDYPAEYMGDNDFREFTNQPF